MKFSIHGSLQNKVSRVISYFYQSRFNDDLNNNYSNHMPAEIVNGLEDGEDSFETWQRLTQIDADPLAWSWHKYKTFEQVFTEIMR